MIWRAITLLGLMYAGAGAVLWLRQIVTRSRTRRAQRIRRPALGFVAPPAVPGAARPHPPLTHDVLVCPRCERTIASSNCGACHARRCRRRVKVAGQVCGTCYVERVYDAASQQRRGESCA